MKILSQDQLFQIWAYDHCTNAYPDVNRDILAACSGVKTLTMVHRENTYIGHCENNLPQYGELFTWIFKGHNGEREVMQTTCQWQSQRNMPEAA